MQILSFRYFMVCYAVHREKSSIELLDFRKQMSNEQNRLSTFFYRSEAAKSTVIGNCDTNKQ